MLLYSNKTPLLPYLVRPAGQPSVSTALRYLASLSIALIAFDEGQRAARQGMYDSR